MAIIKYFSVALVVIILIVVATSNAANHIMYSSILCNMLKMASGEPFVGTVTKLLSLLEETKGQMQVVVQTSGVVAYGISNCPYCTGCLIDIADNIFQLCNYAVGAQVTSTNPKWNPTCQNN